MGVAGISHLHHLMLHINLTYFADVAFPALCEIIRTHVSAIPWQKQYANALGSEKKIDVLQKAS